MSKIRTNTFENIDDVHKQIYVDIMISKSVRLAAKQAKCEVTPEMIHDIVEHSRLCIRRWIEEKLKVIRIPYFGKIYVKHYREELEEKVYIPHRRGEITKDEARERSRDIVLKYYNDREKYKKKKKKRGSYNVKNIDKVDIDKRSSTYRYEREKRTKFKFK